MVSKHNKKHKYEFTRGFLTQKIIALSTVGDLKIGVENLPPPPVNKGLIYFTLTSWCILSKDCSEK